ncbi:MAG TPA: toll/interleukin-1 receptor domain-containing protein [Thermoanaerobaculia bacterium]|nr:toll/interleukin-1 receptor domain-containing protein [Thermoanaerobaculia bacterium]
MPPRAFVSYNHKDVRWKDRLAVQLAVLEREGLLATWHDGLIQAGADWLPEIEAAIANAHVAVLIISADFLNSDFICREEIPALIERRLRDGLRVIPPGAKEPHLLALLVTSARLRGPGEELAEREDADGVRLPRKTLEERSRWSQFAARAFAQEIHHERGVEVDHRSAAVAGLS